MRFSFILITILLFALIGLPLAQGITGSFLSSDASTEDFNYPDSFASNQDMVYLYFKEVNYYQDIQSIIIYNIPATEITFNYSDNSRSVPLTVKNESGSTIATGSLGYGFIGCTWWNPSGNVSLYFYFDSWNIGTESGDKNYTLNYNESALGIDYVERWGAGNLKTDQNHLAIQFAQGILNRELPYNYRVIHGANFRNDYTGVLNGSNVDVTVQKVFSGKGYNSTFIISDVNGFEYLNSSGSVDVSTVKVPSSLTPILLEAYNSYNDYFSALIFTPEAGAFEVAGTVFDSKNGYPLESALIQLDAATYATSDSGGQYNFTVDAGTYNLSCSLTSYETLYYDLYIDNHKTLNLPLSANISNSEVPANTAIIYGVVVEKTTGNPINTARVEVSNDTGLIDFAYTNALGYYEVSVTGVDVYGVLSEKTGYYDAYQSVNVTALNTSYYRRIEMVNPTLITTPTPTPATDVDERTKDRVYSFFEQFGLGEAATNFIIGLLIILACAGIMAGFVQKSAFAGAALGALLGVVVAVGMDLWPFWTIPFLIFIGSLIVAKQYFGDG